MSTTVFVELRFWLLVVFSVILPFGICAGLLITRAISRRSVLWFGFGLVVIAGFDFYLLQSFAALAKASHSIADDTIVASELSLALYILPVMFGGIGVNVVSHVLVQHLAEAEARFKNKGSVS